jgi:hypothetical protein
MIQHDCALKPSNGCWWLQGSKVCILGKACLAPIQPILVAQVTILGANIYFGDEQINIFRSTVLLENIF